VATLVGALCLSVFAPVARASSPGAGGAPEAGAAAIDPSIGLVDGDLIDVTGSGFEPEHFVSVMQCQSAPFDHCFNPQTHFIQSGRSETRSDAAGDVATQFRLHAVIDGVDCRTTACHLYVSDSAVFTTFAEVALDFDADAPLRPQPLLAVTPAGGLADGDEVEVQGTGWFPGEPVLVGQCTDAYDQFDCIPGGTFVDTGADGSFTVPFVVHDAVADTSCIPAGCVIGAVADDVTNPLPNVAIGVVGDDTAPPARPQPTAPSFTG
jgi:hypothetical protein